MFIGDLALTQTYRLPAEEVFLSVEHTLPADMGDAMHYSEEDILFFAQSVDENSTNKSNLICKNLEHRYSELFIVMKHAIYSMYEEENEMRDTSTLHVTKKVFIWAYLSNSIFTFVLLVVCVVSKG